MFETINQELHDLSRPLDVICPEDAVFASRAVAEKIKSLIDAYIVDIYWKRNSGNQPYILEPFVSVRSDFAEQANMIIVNEKQAYFPGCRKTVVSHGLMR